MIIPESTKVKISFKRCPAVYAGQRGVKAHNVLYAIIDNADGRRIGELEISRNEKPWEYVEKYHRGKKAQHVLYLIAALDTPPLLAKLKEQYAGDAPDVTAYIQLPDGTRVPYNLANEAEYTPEDVAEAVLRALQALVSEDLSADTSVQATGRINAFKAQQAQLHAAEIDISFEEPGGLWDTVMQNPDHHAILHEFASNPAEISSPVVVLGPEFLQHAGPVRFIRSMIGNERSNA